MNRYIGRLLDDRYEILEVIGTGGMAVVYKALCHRLNRLVAIKILKDEFSGDDEFRRRFRAEGENVAMLSHPNIVQVYDVSSVDNCNFIVMELIDGISLNQYIQSKGILNWKETLHFSMQIAQGLEHAHSRGIVHRDIKPHNVMVLKNGSVKVMDFGIARVMTKSNTLTKEALGSVHYISPEQAKGGFTDNRSDLYSLSVVMYEMMAGRPPFDGDSPVSVAIQHINGGAPRPSTYNPNIPIGLEQIIMKGMALEVGDRYSSASQMLRDMEEFRKNPAIEFDYTPANGTVDRLKKFPEQVRPKNTAQKVAKSKGGTVTPPRTAGKAPADSMRIAMGNTAMQPNADAIRRAQERRKAEQHRKAERSRMAAAAIIACSVVAVIAIIVFLVAIFNGALLNRESDLVDVPYLVGQYYSEELKAENPKLEIILRPKEYSDDYDVDQILNQEPVSGQVVKGSKLFITVSMGAEPRTPVMENFIGIDIEQVKSFLSDHGYGYLTRPEPNNFYDAGNVIRTDPSAGQPLTAGQTVTLWVSSGPQTVQMPNLVGMDAQTAKQYLEQLGFNNVTVEEVYNEMQAGRVVYQSHPKKTDVALTAEIKLEVSKGPKPKDVEETKPTEPDVPILTEPTEPPKPSDGTISMAVHFSLPVKSSAYTVQIRQGSEIVVPTMELAPGSNGINAELTGKGSVSYDIYINGEFYQTQKVEFK